MAWLQPDGTLAQHRRAGRVREVFPEGFDMSATDGHAALGHVRYATSGAIDAALVQPLVGTCRDGTFALAHNGHVGTFAAGAPGTDRASDSQRLVALLAADPPIARPNARPIVGPDASPELRWVARIERLFAQTRGAWSIAVLTPVGIFAARDPFGIRPLQLGRRDGPTGPAWFVASESCAFDAVGAQLLRDVAPGEIVRLGPDGPQSLHLHTSSARRSSCSFEHVYFAAAISVIDGQTVASARGALGRALARVGAVDADLVLAVPDTSHVAAGAFADAVGLPLVGALKREPEAGRSFIAPTPDERVAVAAAKLVLDPAAVRGKRVVVVDDSLVRGTTARRVVALLKAGGAAAIHLRIASPPVVRGCHLGVDIPDAEALFATTGDALDRAANLGVDSLVFLNHSEMLAILGAGSGRGFCSGCFGGAYPDLDAAGIARR